MEGKTAAIIGATGLIGSKLLNRLLDDPYFEQVVVIARRPLSVSHKKARVVVVDFSDRKLFGQAINGSDMVFCAVGTTQQKVKGDKIAYRKVDYDIPVTAAQLCAEHGVGQFLLVSSIGADSRSGGFYLKLKGEVEDAVKDLDLPSTSVFRPSMLLGDRKEFRLGERIGQGVMRTLSFLIPSRYKAIQAADVARAMVGAAKTERPGFHIYHHSEMMQLVDTDNK
jgi:uncharacterized protein YbjT (DUF2867 family)